MTPNSFETFATVEPSGNVRVAGVPFAPGTQVEVTILPRRASAEEFRSAWQRVCGELRMSAKAESLTDEQIQQEVANYRAGR
jgi:hypothetical protein